MFDPRDFCIVLVNIAYTCKRTINRPAMACSYNVINTLQAEHTETLIDLHSTYSAVKSNKT